MNDYVEVGSLAVFVSGVIVNWKMFTIDGVWQLKKLKSNWKYVSLTVKYPTHTHKIFCTIILPSNHFHSSENSSPHSLSSLTPSPSWRTESRRELSLVKPRSSPRPTALPPCLQAPPPVKVVSHLLHLHPISLTHPTHPSSSPDFIQLWFELIHSLSVSCSSRQSWRWGWA